MISIALVGILISFAAIMSIIAAINSLTNITSIATHCFKMEEITQYGIAKELDGGFIIPAIRGGGRKTLGRYGFSSAMLIPLFLIGSWIVSLYWIPGIYRPIPVLLAATIFLLLVLLLESSHVPDLRLTRWFRSILVRR
jgi:hypothetical protein